jgi:hypothetical protein
MDKPGPVPENASNGGNIEPGTNASILKNAPIDDSKIGSSGSDQVSTIEPSPKLKGSNGRLSGLPRYLGYVGYVG